MAKQPPTHPRSTSMWRLRYLDYAYMLSAWAKRANAVKARIPILSDIHLNFIFLHYVYIISWIIIGSVILYPGHTLGYTDSLFFAGCAATQSGLNTVNFNLLHTYQQIVLYWISMFTTPIFIHTAVVFIRLHWFEKRFQHIVRDARALRSTRSRTRTISHGGEDQDHNREEMGVRGRSIVVLRNSTGRAQPGIRNLSPKAPDEVDSEPGTPNDKDGVESSDERESDHDRSLSLSMDGLRIPQLSPEEHIAFLEKQRQKTGAALRIPSPREYDRGGVPEVLDDVRGSEEEDEEASRAQTNQSAERSRTDGEQVDGAVPLEGPHITINEPELPRSRTRVSTFPRMDTRPTVRETYEVNDPPALIRNQTRRGTFASIFPSLTREQDRSTAPYLSWNATVGRNSNFVDLTEEQRNELGGIEYRSLKTLAVVLVAYYVCFHVLGMVSLVGWIMTTHWGHVVMEDGQGRPWWGIFTAESAFNDVGFTLTPDSMASFQGTVFPLLLMSFLIIIGNTGFPCMLRLIIWGLSKIVRRGSAVWEELKFLQDHPRRCFTLLFPRNATFWLFAILVALNGIDVIFFIILDLNNPAVTDNPPGIRVLDGFFQATSTRTAGFSVVDISSLHPAMQVSYMIMMYISVFPVAISLRRTNVYEEKSLGIYGSNEESDEDAKTASYIGAHLRKQLSFDLWYVFLGLFIIAIVEGPRLMNKSEYGFQLFDVLFEIVSAYGTVGMSMGYPGTDASFSGQFKVISKLVIIAMQIRGRHRGLPYALDRAILLPSESLRQREIEDAERRMCRRSSNISTTPSVGQQQPQLTETGVSTGLDAQQKDKRQGMNDDVVLRRQQTFQSQR